MRADDGPDFEARTAASEAPPLAEGPRTGVRLGWLALGVLVVVMVVSGVMLAGRLTGGRPVAGTPTTVAGGGGTFTGPSPSPPGPPSVSPSERPGGSVIVTTPSGERIGVAGVGKTETIACRDRPASVSGVDNQVVLTGHCTRVDVSGIRNTVTIDAADAIDVSGMDNRVTYKSGNPSLTRSGLRNSLEPG